MVKKKSINYESAAGPKSKEYNYEAKTQNPLKDFIREYGKHQTTTFRNETPREEHILVSGNPNALQKNPKQEIREATLRLRNIIQENP